MPGSEFVHRPNGASAVRAGYRAGRARGPPRWVRPAGGGDGCQRYAPKLIHALPTGRATNFVLSPDFTRTSTVCLPAERASAITCRTSAGVETDLPATSRIMSPEEKPWSAATPDGSTCVTTTPFCPAPATRSAGASVSPSFAMSVVPEELSLLLLLSLRASCCFGIVPSVRLIVFSEPLCRIVNLTDVPG